MRSFFTTTLFLVLPFVLSNPLVARPPVDEPETLRILSTIDPESPFCLPPAAPGSTVQVHFDFETSLNDITHWYWDFGDGQFSNQPNPVHAYDHTGSFTVSLTVDSLVAGLITIVEENFVQVNELIFEDDFGNSDFTAAKWEHFDALTLLQDEALKFDLAAITDPNGQQNGEIICLGPDIFRREPPAEPNGEPNGRFRFDLELSDHRTLPYGFSYKALRLLASSETALAELRLRTVEQGFELQIASDGVNESPWLLLAGSATPKVRVELDWYQVLGSTEGAFELRVIDPTVPEGPQLSLRLDKLYYGSLEPGFDTLELGVVQPNNGSGQSAGTMRVDNFQTCRFDYRPSSP